MELFAGATVAICAFVMLFYFAPRLGGPTSEPTTKGLTALQTIFALLGIILVIEWYVVEQPDAARLKFDQSVSGARLGDGRALVTIEVTISNVGGHADRFDKLPYKIFVQQIAPLPKLLGPMTAPAPNGEGKVWRADNWETLAYRAVGTSASPNYPNWDGCSRTKANCDDGLETLIEPGESENLYFAAVVPCIEDLHVSVSSRFTRPPGVWEDISKKKREVWIKQSFLDLTQVCNGHKNIDENAK